MVTASSAGGRDLSGGDATKFPARISRVVNRPGGRNNNMTKTFNGDIKFNRSNVSGGGNEKPL